MTDKEHWLLKLVKDEGGVYRQYRSSKCIIHSVTQYDEPLTASEMLNKEVKETPSKIRRATDKLVIIARRAK